MVKVLDLTGFAHIAASGLNLGAYLEGDIGRLVSAAFISRPAQTPTFAGSALALTFAGSALADHRHNLVIERTDPATAAASLALQIAADGVLFGQTPPAPSMPTAIQNAGGFTPSGAITTPVTPVGTISQVGGLAYTPKTVLNNGLLSAGATAAAGQVVLSGRQQLNFGDALDSNVMVHLTIQYVKETGGVF